MLRLPFPLVQERVQVDSMGRSLLLWLLQLLDSLAADGRVRGRVAGAPQRLSHLLTLMLLLKIILDKTSQLNKEVSWSW